MADAKTPSRTGLRDGLGARLLITVIFVPALWAITRRGDLHFLVAICLMVLTGLYEFYKLLEHKGFRPAKAVGIGCGLAITAYAFFRTGIYGNFLLAATLLLMMTVELMRRSTEQAVLHISTTIFGVLYVGWLGSHLVLLRELPRLAGLDYQLGADFVYLVVFLTWSCDSGAYLIGRAFGRTPLFPRVSPKKTREGAVGGVAFSLIAAYLSHRTFASEFLDLDAAIWLGLLAAVAGMTGDLVESLMKRDVDVKDSASLLPGHGGALDRFDSLFFSAPLLYYSLKFFVI